MNDKKRKTKCAGLTTCVILNSIENVVNMILQTISVSVGLFNSTDNYLR